MKLTKILSLCCVLLVSTAVLASCGSGGSQSSSPSSSEAVSSESQSVQDSQAGEAPSESGEEAATPTLDKIRSRGKLIMLTNAAFPPFEYLGADNQVAGVDADIAAEIAKEIGVELEIVDMDFDGITMAVSSGQGDLGVAGITANDERRLVVDFSINYVETSQLIAVREDSDIQSPDDLVGKNIGVQLGTTGDIFASDVEGANISRFKTGPDAGLALANGQIDCVVIDAMPAEKIVEANTGLKLLEEPFTEEQYAIAMAKDSEDLKEVVDRVLQRMLDDGTIDSLIAEHMEALAS